MLKPLSQQDYRSILKYYNIPAPKNKYKRKKIAEDTLASKLCKCIKKVSSQRIRSLPISKRTRKRRKLSLMKAERDATGICRNSVIQKKGLHNFGFTCKKKSTLRKRKGHTIKLAKIKNVVKILKDRKSN